MRGATLVLAALAVAGCAGRKPDPTPPVPPAVERPGAEQPGVERPGAGQPVVARPSPTPPAAPPPPSVPPQAVRPPAAVAPAPVPVAPPAERITFASIPGWAEGDHAPALIALRDACEGLSGRAADATMGGPVLGGEPVFGRMADWRPICAEAASAPPGQATAFFERWFEPVSIRGAGRAEATLFTAYFEPELRGSLTRGGPYQHALYRMPQGLVPGSPQVARAAIDAGSLANRGLELAWVDDPVDSFFLHIQGSGRVRLPDGRVLRVGYAGKNGHSYIPIGRVLVERGVMALEDVSLQSIRAWLAANPDRAFELMAQNPSYVFFEPKPELSADLGPIGSFGTPLPAMRAVAVDRRHVPLGAPVWVDFESPVGPVRRLTVALDTGGAIKGPRRADFFFGSGAAAGEAAGATRAYGRMLALAPTAALRRVFRAGT